MDLNTEEQFIKNYEVVRVLGEGSFGKVFLVRNIYTLCEYAMKKYSYYYLKKNGKDLSLQRSVKILKNLNHKGILKIIKYIITKEDSIYIFFEACKKGSLQKIAPLLKQAKQRILIDFVIFQLIEGLKYLKSVSVAHRDLKPSNIAFTSEGELKIIDFDEAICFNSLYVSEESMKLPQFPQTDNPIYVSRRSRAMSYVGTMTYMSPQMRQKTQSDERADVWALGCIIYEIFMNASIFDDIDFETSDPVEQIQEKLTNIKTSDIAVEYQSLLEKILTINPDTRISIDQIYESPIFQKFRKSFSFYQSCQQRFKKLLRGNHTIPNPQTLYDALTVDLIGMKAGKQIFQKLKTIILLNKKHSYDINYLYGGGQYFKIRDIKNPNSKKYIFYDAIDSIKIVNQFIVIKIVVEQWSHCSDKINQDIYLKHFYEDQDMLGKLYDLMLQVYND